MMCFRDMTFCGYASDCKDAEGCPRALTEEVRREATEWWGSDEAPIAVFSDKPECFNEKE